MEYYVHDRKVENLSDKEKYDALEPDIINFDNIALDVCERCNKRDNCNGYFSGSCVCDWSELLTFLVKADIAGKYAKECAMKSVEQYNRTHPYPYDDDCQHQPAILVSSSGGYMQNYG